MKLARSEILLLAILFVFGGLFLFSYGAHLDQRSEQEILFYNIRAYCDAVHYEGQFYQDLVADNIISIRDSIEKDHGMSVYYPLFWIFRLNQVNGYVANFVWHGYIYLLCFLGVIGLYLLLRELFSGKTAMFAVLCFFFTPRIFAEMHYNNKDMIVLSLVLLTYSIGYALRKNTTYKNAILFGTIGAFTANMKIIGLFIWGLIGLYVAVCKIKETPKDKSLYIKMLVAILWAAVLSYLITPAMWGDVLGYFEYVIKSAQNFRWNGEILYGGKLVNRLYMAFPRKYIPVMILLTTPIGILLLAVAGCIGIVRSLILRKKNDKKEVPYLIVTVLGGMIPLFYAVIKSTPVYNGWRHFYFVYASIIILVAAGIHWFLKLFEEKKLSTAVMAGYIIALVLGILINHPYEYVYYNALAGKNVETKYELDYWDMSVKQGLETILAVETEDKITVSFCDNYTRWGGDANLSVLKKADVDRIGFTEEMTEAEYVIANRTYSEIYSKEKYLYLKENYETVGTLKAYGNIICEVFQKR